VVWGVWEDGFGHGVSSQQHAGTATLTTFSFRSWESAELEKGRLEAMRLCKEYNKTDPFEDGVERVDVLLTRTNILKSLLGDMQGTPNIETPFSVLYGCNTSIGRSFFGNVGWFNLSTWFFKQ
jgi:hypothetical protein